MFPWLANSIWNPLVIYHYGSPHIWVAIVVGFTAEWACFWLYTRDFLPFGRASAGLVKANLVSYVVGHVCVSFFPFDMHKFERGATEGAFLWAYFVTVVIEYWVLRSLLPTRRALLQRAVAMSNLMSYAVLYVGFRLWELGWSHILRAWTRTFS